MREKPKVTVAELFHQKNWQSPRDSSSHISLSGNVQAYKLDQDNCLIYFVDPSAASIVASAWIQNKMGHNEKMFYFVQFSRAQLLDIARAEGKWLTDLSCLPMNKAVISNSSVSTVEDLFIGRLKKCLDAVDATRIELRKVAEGNAFEFLISDSTAAHNLAKWLYFNCGQSNGQNGELPRDSTSGSYVVRVDDIFKLNKICDYIQNQDRFFTYRLLGNFKEKQKEFVFNKSKIEPKLEQVLMLRQNALQDMVEYARRQNEGYLSIGRPSIEETTIMEAKGGEKFLTFRFKQQNDAKDCQKFFIDILKLNDICLRAENNTWILIGSYPKRIIMKIQEKQKRYGEGMSEEACLDLVERLVSQQLECELNAVAQAVPPSGAKDTSREAIKNPSQELQQQTSRQPQGSFQSNYVSDFGSGNNFFPSSSSRGQNNTQNANTAYAPFPHQVPHHYVDFPHQAQQGQQQVPYYADFPHQGQHQVPHHYVDFPHQAQQGQQQVPYYAPFPHQAQHQVPPYAPNAQGNPTASQLGYMAVQFNTVRRTPG